MRIVNRETFLQLPSNTVFVEYDNFPFEAICIKGDTVGECDFYVQHILEVKCKDVGDQDNILTAAKNGATFQLDFDCIGRDGLFEEEQLFVVFEKSDVLMLIERLKKCVI